MNFSRFFVDRPIFAAVLSIIILAVGLISIPNLPISEYPDVVPPSVVVRTVYPGANPKEIAETVATPLEEAINGVEDMMYLKSVAGSDGVLLLWDVPHGRRMLTFQGHRDRVVAVCLSSDGRFAVSGSWDNTLRVWDVATPLLSFL